MAKILFLAPQPFYKERGTPIAIDLALQALEQDGHKIDLVTYPEGEARTYYRIRHYRVIKVPGVNKVGPGFSWQKTIYSFLMIFTALRLSILKKYDFVHAVEEACFIALFLKKIRRLPYIYDMDSSIAQQLVEKKPILRKFSMFFNKLEELAIRQALAVVAVCPALVNLAHEKKAKKVLLLQDISLFDRCNPKYEVTDLRKHLDSETLLLLYVGNLEMYQGIDLLLEGFSRARAKEVNASLAIIGGQAEDIVCYQEKATMLGIADRTYFFGPKPVNELGGYLNQADILVSPRVIGNNTPMKIYTYLNSGKALLATSIYSHTQVLDDSIAYLVAPTPKAMSEGIQKLCRNPSLRKQLGQAGFHKAEKEHSFSQYRKKLTSFYNTLNT